jgi:hypothetical protein
MNINKYIDCYLINEYANKSLAGYTLDVETLPDNELSSFLDLLMSKDAALRESVVSHMQDLIDQRLPLYEADEMRDMGYRAMQDSNNGELIWMRA